MNTVSPLSKDQRVKKTSKERVIKQKPNISLSTAKKILKASKRVIGETETLWLNRYIENRIRGECLPLSLYTNDLQSEIINTFGTDAPIFINKILLDFETEMPNPFPDKSI